jgi:hypothetical protein
MCCKCVTEGKLLGAGGFKVGWSAWAANRCFNIVIGDGNANT